jgi:hypothetical protein
MTDWSGDLSPLPGASRLSEPVSSDTGGEVRYPAIAGNEIRPYFSARVRP